MSNYDKNQIVELSDEAMEAVAGGVSAIAIAGAKKTDTEETASAIGASTTDTPAKATIGDIVLEAG